MGPVAQILAELDKVERPFQTVVVTGRNEELRRTHALLEQQCATVTLERDNLRSRLNAARNRIDTLLARPDMAPLKAWMDRHAPAWSRL